MKANVVMIKFLTEGPEKGQRIEMREADVKGSKVYSLIKPMDGNIIEIVARFDGENAKDEAIKALKDYGVTKSEAKSA